MLCPIKRRGQRGGRKKGIRKRMTHEREIRVPSTGHALLGDTEHEGVEVSSIQRSTNKALRSVSMDLPVLLHSVHLDVPSQKVRRERSVWAKGADELIPFGEGKVVHAH